MGKKINTSDTVVIIISVITIIIGLANEMPGLAGVGVIFILYALFLD